MQNDIRNKITLIHELPCWFDIDKYRASSELNAKGWYEQLFIRYFLYRVSDHEALQSDIFDLIRDKPIIKINDDSRFEVIMRFSSSRSHGKIQSDLHLSTPRDLLQYSKSVTREHFNYSVRYLTQNHLNPTVPYEEFIDEPISCVSEATSMGNVAVSFNPNLPEEVLFKQFREQVRKVKSSYSLQKRHQKYDYDRWSSYGILPYLDLDAWTKQNNKKITVPVLTEVIYPAGEKSEENMKKTTIECAEKLMNDNALLKLAAQIELKTSESC